jgi:hypothetical protein
MVNGALLPCIGIDVVLALIVSGDLVLSVGTTRRIDDARVVPAIGEDEGHVGAKARGTPRRLDRVLPWGSARENASNSLQPPPRVPSVCLVRTAGAAPNRYKLETAPWETLQRLRAQLQRAAGDRMSDASGPLVPSPAYRLLVSFFALLHRGNGQEADSGCGAH